jgi:CubicO group peptidase (beta-lactamase class C family)
MPQRSSAILLYGALLGIAMPATASTQDLAPNKWTILGPYSNPSVNGRRTGLDVDHLKGEASLRRPSGKTAVGRSVDLAAIFPDSENKVAYAYGVIKSPKAQTLTALFGSDDGAKVWVGGQLVHRIDAGRALNPEEDTFPVPLIKGENPILIKIENGSGGWGFAFSLPNEKAMKARAELDVIRSLPDREIVPRAHAGFGRLLAGSEFPQLVWKDGLLVAPYLKDLSLKVRWFNQEGLEVQRASSPGLYLAWVESETRNGSPLQRILTFCLPTPEVGDTLSNPLVQASLLHPSPQSPVPALANAWPSARVALLALGSSRAAENLFSTDEGAIWTAALMGWKPEGSSTLAWVGAVNQLQLKVKMAALGMKARPLRAPVELSAAAPRLREGTDSEAGMKPGTAAKVKAILEEWSKEEGKPFSAVIARRGVAFVYQGFGVEKDAVFYPASIGKTLFGLVFAQFADQGLVKREQPLGDFLPVFPKTGPKAITFRGCLTHTSGTSGHGTYGGWSNPTLEAAFSLWLPSLTPHERFTYGGDGNNLAMKALEVISGIPAPSLLERQLFGPLGVKIIQPDGGWSSEATSWDIAKVGQMMANRGSYGGYRFLSEEGFAAFLPIKVQTVMKSLSDPNLEWGDAVSYMPDPDGPRTAGALGPNVIGHGSASSSILRVDLDSGLVVVIGRYGVGKEEAYVAGRVKLMKALKEGLAP